MKNKYTLNIKNNSITEIISMKEDMINMKSHYKEVEVIGDGVSNLIMNQSKDTLNQINRTNKETIMEIRKDTRRLNI